ncbi:MAG: TonB-dependent receptor [Acidobacteria bacterium]|nr:TonB-dependent receptor [Acidobacteriota bacterium]MCI0724401.1 TonB-dependent receptor [Acidobacteriota bacterium]
MKVRYANLALLLSVLLFTTQAALGQTAQITGRVADSTNAVVPDAKINVRNVDTGIENPTSTNESGYYTVPLLPPGKYEITAQKPGFRPITRSGIKLEVQQVARIDFVMQVGEITQTIEVSAAAPLLQQSTSELGTVITEQAVKELPLNGRNFTQLLTLTPGATPVNTAQGNAGGTGFNAPLALPGSTFVIPSINGQWNRSNLFLLDGIVNEFFFGSSYAILPIIDAVQEFKVQSHNDKAEYGGVLGGVINVVSKSGGNQLHGSAWEFVRNDVFDARDPFKDAARKGPTAFRQNMFGATVGGPVYVPKLYNGKDKTWFFFGYEGWRYRRAQQQLYNVPTAQELTGDFSNSINRQIIFDPATTRLDPANPQRFIRDPFPGNIIPAGRINPMARQYIETYFDRPVGTGVSGFNAINSNPQRSDADTYQVKIDHRFANNDSVWFRLSDLSNPQVIPTTLKSDFVYYQDPKNIAGGWNHLFGPAIILDSKFGFVTQPVNQFGVSSAGLDIMRQLGYGGIDRFGPVNINLRAPYGGSSIATPRPNTDSQYHFAESLSWVKGNHYWKFGMQYVWQTRDNITTGHSYEFENAQTADPQNQGSTGNSLASALLGLPQQAVFWKTSYRTEYPSWGLYAQDEWKVSPKVTLNLGFRFDHYGVPHLTSGMNNGFDWNTGDWLIGGGKLPPPCSQAGKAPCIPGDGTLASIPNGNHIRVGEQEDFTHPVWDGFQPRVGVAWNVLDKTVIRGGYGLVFDVFTGISQSSQQSIGTWPDNQISRPTFNFAGQTLTNLQQIQGQTNSPLPGPTPFGNVGWYIDPRFKNAYSHQWNVEIQQQFTDNLVMSVAYVGSRTHRLDHNGLANTATQPGPGTPEQVRLRRPFPYQTTMNYSLSTGQAWYDSFQFKANRRFTGGLQFLVSYTWSKSLDLGSSGWFAAENGASQGNSALQNYYDPKGSKGVSGYDVPHFLSISSVYELPFGKGKARLNSGIGAAILGGWQTNVIAQLRSGQPYNLAVVGDVANIGNEIAGRNYARPNIIGDPQIETPTPQRWFNPAAFQIPSFSYGNFGRNVLRSDGVANVDFSLFKNIPFGETVKLQLRAEAFNIFNIMSFGVPNGLLNQPTTARVTSLAQGISPRQLQFGLKIEF